MVTAKEASLCDTRFEPVLQVKETETGDMHAILQHLVGHAGEGK